MKQFIYSIIALTFVLCNGCTNNEFVEYQNGNVQEKDTPIFSRNAANIDYNQYSLLEKQTIMPRTGEYYHGIVTYKDTAFPLHIYWDLEIENYNLYAYIDGINQIGYGTLYEGNYYYDTTYRLDHVATYCSECSNTRFDFVIQCNFSKSYYNGINFGSWTDHRHVAFHVVFFPTSRSCSSEIIEEGEGVWDDPDLERP